MHWGAASLSVLAGLGGASALLYAVNFRAGSVLLGIASPKDPIAGYPYVFLPLFALYLCALALGWGRRSTPLSLGLILAFALTFRAILVPTPLVLSTDLYRYIWDGRVQAAGMNPYLHRPSAPALAGLRDAEIFPFINRPYAPTIYPPGAQMAFALIHRVVPDSITGMKAVMVLLDLVTVGLIVCLLRQVGLAADRVLVYAWSPLVIFEFGSSGHAEALMLPFALLALIARVAQRPLASGAFLGIATLIKLYPAILAPVLYRRGERLFPVAFGTTIMLGYLSYLGGAGGGVVGFLPAYFIAPWEDFNVGLRDFLAAALGLVVPLPRFVAMVLVMAGLVWGVVRLSHPEQDGDVLWRAYLMVSTYIVLMPTSFHPWYLVWLLPFLCVYPSWGWLYLSAAISLSYLKYVQSPPVMPAWVRPVEFLPLYALLGVEAVRHRWTTPPSGHPVGVAVEKA